MIVVGVLNHNRYELLSRTLSSVEYLADREDVRFVLHDNGSEVPVVRKISSEWGHLFAAIHRAPSNIGIGGGMNKLHELARTYEAEFYLHLENDWEVSERCLNKNWFQESVDILKRHIDVGVIKLRIENDGQYEMSGHNVANGTAEKYSPWWVPDTKVGLNTYSNDGIEYSYALLERGYTNNPHLLRMDMIKDWRMKDDSKGYGLEEEDWEIGPAKESWATANFKNGVFTHIG